MMTTLKKFFVLLGLVVSLSLLGGCAKNTLGSPCPNFGKYCAKAPVNSWNYNK